MTEPTAVSTPVETQEAFLADRQRIWESFTSFSSGALIAVILLLIAMAVFV